MVTEVPSLKFEGVDSKDQDLLILKVQEYLESFWLHDEVIIYIGKAGTSNTIYNRIKNFKKHQLGCKRPHRGGHWLKTLSKSTQNELVVYWAITIDAEKIETKLLEKFSKNNQKNIPFANLEYKENGIRKRKQTKMRETVKKCKSFY